MKTSSGAIWKLPACPMVSHDSSSVHKSKNWRIQGNLCPYPGPSFPGLQCPELLSTAPALTVWNWSLFGSVVRALRMSSLENSSKTLGVGGDEDTWLESYGKESCGLKIKWWFLRGGETETKKGNLHLAKKSNFAAEECGPTWPVILSIPILSSPFQSCLSTLCLEYSPSFPTFVERFLLLSCMTVFFNTLSVVHFLPGPFDLYPSCGSLYAFILYQMPS